MERNISRNPEEAYEEFTKFGAILFLNCPGGCNIGVSDRSEICVKNRTVRLSIGIDRYSWTVGDKFLGVHSLKPGVHLLYWSAEEELGGGEVDVFANDDIGNLEEYVDDKKVNESFAPNKMPNTEMNVGMRSSRFIYINPPEKGVGHVMVFQWNDETETFDELNEGDSNRFAEGLHSGSFMPNVGPYPGSRTAALNAGMTEDTLGSCDNWEELTSFIHTTTISRVEPIGSYIKSKQQEYDLKTDIDAKRTDVDNVETFQERLSTGLLGKSGEGGRLLFLDIPSKRATFMTASEITAVYLDQSKTLEAMLKSMHEILYAYIKKFRNGESMLLPPERRQGLQPEQQELLGELQMAYISFVVGLNYDAFSHWREMLVLLSNCISYMLQNITFFKAFLRVLYYQLEGAPADFFSNELLKNNFLTSVLANLMDIIDEAPSPPRSLIKYYSHLQQLLEKKFNVNINIIMYENEEDLPTIYDPEEATY